MTKEANHVQNPQQPLYPTQLPPAPPTYDEAIYGIGPQANPTYPIQTTATGTPTENRNQVTVYNQTNPAVGTYTTPATGTVLQPPVIEVQRTIIALPLGPNPARIKCPNCRYDIRTSIDSEPNCAAHLCCVLLLLIGCCPFSSLPYCMDSMRNVRHTCPNCNSFLGYYQP